MVTLIREADKLTLEQDINVKVPHAFMVLMNGQSHKWLTSCRWPITKDYDVRILKSGVKLNAHRGRAPRS
jgi:hypothetical protein